MVVVMVAYGVYSGEWWMVCVVCVVYGGVHGGVRGGVCDGEWW